MPKTKSASPLKPIHLMTPSEVAAELASLLAKHNFVRPARSTIDASLPWLNGAPNYASSDLAFFRGRSVAHTPDSLEDVVENAIKTWERDATHLAFPDWTAVDHDIYNVSANGGKVFVGDDAARAGNYNWLMDNADPALYDAQAEDFESSHAKFREAMPGGFPFEVLKVFSGPPTISFSWRHWGMLDGVYKGKEGDEKKYDMYGWGLLEVNAELKVRSIRIFYKPNEWLKALERLTDPKDLERGESLIGNGVAIASGCPFAHKGEAKADN